MGVRKGRQTRFAAAYPRQFNILSPKIATLNRAGSLSPAPGPL
jgi:hypothetical protein